MVGLLYTQKTNELDDNWKIFDRPIDLNDGIMNEVDLPFYDCYMQEYFLFVYSHLTKDRDNFKESEEGHIYVKK